MPRFDPGKPIDWVWAYSLGREQPVLVSEVQAFYHAGSLSDRFVHETSNGNASGSTLTEATLHGLLEIIERDAFLIAWYGGIPLRELDAASLADSASLGMIRRLEFLGYRARFFDTTLASRVPVVTAVAQRMEPGFGNLCFGAGASLDPSQALHAALAEIASDIGIAAMRSTSRSTELAHMASNFEFVRDMEDHADLFAHPSSAHLAAFLLDGQVAKGSLLEGIAPSRTLYEDLRKCVDSVVEQGHDVVVLDQTTALQRSFGLHSSKVFVPGFVPIDFGWGMQRALMSPRVRSIAEKYRSERGETVPFKLNAVPHPFP
jgi:ribosomal protein S12 methylthiotransferase accessory factor